MRRLLTAAAVLAMAVNAGAYTLRCDPITNQNGTVASDVRYVWTVNGSETVTTLVSSNDIPTPGSGTTRYKVFAEYGTRINDSNGERVVWERDPVGSNEATITRGFWGWLRRLFIGS